MLYKLVFEFIIPVYNASKRMKDQVGQMQQKMYEEQQRRQADRNGYVEPQAAKAAPDKGSDKDYIEFEEVK